MSVPFKFKTSFREVFTILAGRDGKLADVKDFHGYMKAPFSNEVLEKCPKNMIQDSFMAFLAEAQKESGVSYDDILWNFVEKFIKHQIFDGKDTMEMKPLRTFYDPLFKSLRQDPEALWAKYCGSSASNATVSGLKSLVKDLNGKGTAGLPDLLKAALPKNKPLKPAPAMRMASPKRHSSTPPTTSASSCTPSKPASPPASQAKKDSPTPSTATSATSPKPSAKKDDADDKKSAAASSSAPPTPDNEPNSNAAAAASSSSTADKKPDAAEQVEPPPPPPPPKEQVPPAAAAALASASNVPPPLQPTALGATISKTASASSQQTSSPTQQNPAAAVIAPKLPGGSIPSQQQQQQQQQQPVLHISQNVPLGLPPGTPTITVPPQIASAVAEIDQRHEKIRAEIEAQTAALLSADSLLLAVAQRMQQVKPLAAPSKAGHAKTAATDKFRRDLDSVRSQMSTFCATVGAEADGFRRHVPQYVADLGRGVVAGKALEHPPNDDFSELRLNALLAAVRKDTDEARAKEQAAQRLEAIQAQEEALKKEIAALEARSAIVGAAHGGVAGSGAGEATGGANVSGASRGVASSLQRQQQQQLLLAMRQQQKSLAQQSTPPAASGTFVHSAEVVKMQQDAAAAVGHSAASSPALSIAQRIAARVTDQQMRGHGTQNFTMPATSSSYRGY